jgi:two-component sensor histidine kinase
MDKLGDHPDLLSRLGDIQRDLVANTHRMARAARGVEKLPHGGSLAEAVALVLRAACESLGFERAYAYLMTEQDLHLRGAWPRGYRAPGRLERTAVRESKVAASRAGRAVAIPLVLNVPEAQAGAAQLRGALRLEGRTARPVGDLIAPILHFAEAAATALENAALAESVRSQGARIATLSTQLTEANHRIKNNLQALVGFLTERSRDAAASSRALREGIGRIMTIAALHEALSCAADERADLGALTRRICAETAAADQVADGIAVVVAADSMHAAPRICRAYALALHELVSNALHHAYPPGVRGEVRVTLRTAAQSATLEVADDGVGMQGWRRGLATSGEVAPGSNPAPPGQAGHTGMGLAIAAAIVEHELGGRLRVTGENGTTVRVEFPLSETA